MIRLLLALIAVESGGNNDAVGDHGTALGCLQIHMGVIKDVNRISGDRFRHRDAFDRFRALRIATIYLGYYASPQRLGHEPTFEDMARIWKGGPQGWRDPRTRTYWRHVKNILDRTHPPIGDSTRKQAMTATIGASLAPTESPSGNRRLGSVSLSP